MKITPIIKTDGVVIANVANSDKGNADTSYVYFNIGRDGFTHFSLQYVIQATTLTFEATNERENVTDANATWTDITEILMGSGNTTITSTGIVIADTKLAVGRMRVKCLTTNATNALKLILGRSN